MGNTLSLIDDYLANRTQNVTLNGKLLSMRQIATGVPQGSVLSPFLFLLYINDLPNACKTAKMTLSADDTSLYRMENKSTQK